MPSPDHPPRTVTRRVAVRRRARAVTTPKTPAPAGRLPRITRLMALAIYFDELIRCGEVKIGTHRTDRAGDIAQAFKADGEAPVGVDLRRPEIDRDLKSRQRLLVLLQADVRETHVDPGLGHHRDLFEHGLEALEIFGFVVAAHGRDLPGQPLERGLVELTLGIALLALVIGTITYSTAEVAIALIRQSGTRRGGSVAYGGTGLYRSGDGGETWEPIGLENTGSIGRILVDPVDSDRVFVAAMGHLWTSGDDRGIYRTTNGGATWQKVLFIDQNTGCVDIIQRPDQPDVLLAAMWQRLRQPEFYDYGGPECSVHRSTDGGRTWERSGDGLPHGNVRDLATVPDGATVEVHK